MLNSGIYLLTEYLVSDAPVYLSFPHFYKADPNLMEPFEGLKPVKEKHENYMKIQPVSLLNKILTIYYNNSVVIILEIRRSVRSEDSNSTEFENRQG